MTELELDTLHQKVDDLGNEVLNTLTRSTIHSIKCDRKIDRIKKCTDNMTHSDIEDEMDALTLANSSNSARLLKMENDDYNSQIEGLQEKIATVEGLLDAMDEDHKVLIQGIADSISENTERIAGITEMFGGVKHKLISEDEFLALGQPDEDTLYFTYEE